MDDKYLWSFYWDCGRLGEVDGLFVATEEEVKDAIDKEVYFGEILGKHSEVYGKLEQEDLTKLDVSIAAINEVSTYLGQTWSGYNPLNYMSEDDIDNDDEEVDEDDE